MGTVQMVVAAVAMGVVGAFSDGTARPMVIAFAACALAALAITFATLRGSSEDDGRMLEVPAE
jgi:DHA1 family bicyclomycin/chloramphenicol resistance-like MFS transporter